MLDPNQQPPGESSRPESTGAANLVDLVCPVPVGETGRITLAHGSGGKLTEDLIRQVFLPAFGNPLLNKLNDQAVFDVGRARLALTTDAFVVSPLFFPGGDIGKLAVNGTLNDLATSGAKPLYLAAAFILEEGLDIDALQQVVASMRAAAVEADVMIVTGDTKVVERGHGDGMFITTTGVGLVPEGVDISVERAQPGDRVMVSGPIAQHGMAVMARREGLDFDIDLESDTVALYPLVQTMLAVTTDIHVLRDPTRGGLATTLNEIAERSQAGMLIEEEQIPVQPEVEGLCEILGLDPLYVANEGKLVAVVPPRYAEEILGAMRGHPLGHQAAIIGEVTAAPRGAVYLRTCVGGTRVIDVPVGDQLPRIC